MEQTKKSPCLYHIDGFITNFCRDKNCLMPLCPSCIGQHTEYHQEINNKPIYHNIMETLADVQNLLYNTIYSLEQDRKRNNQLIDKIQSIDDFIKEKVLATKTLIYDLIDEAFVQLETNLKINLNKLHDQIGLYSQRKAQKNQEILLTTLDQLYQLSEGLKGQKYLGNIIIYLKDKHLEANSLHSKITTYLTANQNYKPALQISNQSKHSLVNIISRLIKIDDRQLNQRKSSYQPKDYSRKKITLQNKGQKSDKMEKVYTPQKTSAYTKIDQSSRVRQNAVNNSPYRDKQKSTKMLQKSGQQSSRQRDFKQEYEALSRKVSQMRRDNQLLLRNKR